MIVELVVNGGPQVVEVVGQTAAGLDHDGTVHSIRPGTDFAAEPGGSEEKARAHSIGQCRFVFGGHEFLHLGPSDGVGIAFDPIPGGGHEGL